MSSTTTAFGRSLREQGMSFTAAAAALGVTKSHVSAIATGKARPSADLMRRIEEWTGGAVRMTDWFDTPAGGGGVG